MRALFLSLAAALALQPLAAVQEQQAPVFRGRTDAVVVDVSVWTGSRPVLDLQPGDFELHDSGVRQTIDDVELGDGSLDLSLLVEEGPEAATREFWHGVSGIGETFISERLDAARREAAGLLRQHDRLRMLSFDHEVREWGAPTPEYQIRRGGTVLFDAVVAAAMRPVEPGRRHLVVALTRGIDHHSLIPAQTTTMALARSGVVVHMIAISSAPRSFYSAGQMDLEQRSVTVRAIGSYDWVLRRITDLTGGRLFNLHPNDNFVDALRKAVDEYRARYRLRYTPANVPQAGWHPIEVKVTRRGRYDVRARPGYWR